MTSPLTSVGAGLAVPVNDQDHIRGDPDAPVTLVEYGDYQCPYCGMAHPNVQELLRRRTGLVRLVYRHFPLTNVHPYAEPAAEAAEAAGVQGRFWEAHDWMFANQDRLDPSSLIPALAGLGLDAEAIADAMVHHTYLTKVQHDFIGGVHSGVNGTPTFFINGMRHAGGYSVPELAAAVDRAASPTTLGSR